MLGPLDMEKHAKKSQVTAVHEDGIFPLRLLHDFEPHHESTGAFVAAVALAQRGHGAEARDVFEPK